MKKSNILISEFGVDYELIDSGLGEKLERFGKYILSRPDPQALWAKRLDISEWKKADAKFTRENLGGEENKNKSGWIMKNTIVDRWSIELGGLKMEIRPTAFKHVGLFPEQVVNWQWISKIIQIRCSVIPANAGIHVDSLDPHFHVDDKVDNGGEGNNDVEVLNLFGYTGGATLACAKAGAKVVHVDGSKAAITWAKTNAELSDLTNKPIRWILDDARTFVSREIKRGRKYAGIIMDPPAFGHGPDNELWKIEEHFLPLVEDCMKILNDKPSFFLINGYSAGYSAIAYENMLLPLVEKYGGTIEIGELAIQESKKEGLYSRILPCGIFARWKK